jgi:hypothetical protein
VPNYGDVYGCLNCINNAAYFRNGTLLPYQQIHKSPLGTPARVLYSLGLIVGCMSVLGTAVIVMPSVFPRLFKHYDCKNHKWLSLCIQLLANSFKFDKANMALIFFTFGVALAFASGFKIIPPENTGYLGWTSTTSYTYALLFTGIIAAVRHVIWSGARI